MDKVLSLKFQQHPELRKLLLDTGNAVLVEVRGCLLDSGHRLTVHIFARTRIRIPSGETGEIRKVVMSLGGL